MRIAILTSGRFHLLDLARELSALGHEVLFYSLVPPVLTRRHGLPARCNRWLGPHVAPVYAVNRLSRGARLQSRTDHWLIAALDIVAANFIEPCDVLIAISGLGLRAVNAARERYGAKVFVERGSRHILSQREILTAISGITDPVPSWAVKRELAAYDRADVVAVPATHVVESFLEHGFQSSRLFQNPYGTSLETFRPTLAPASEPKTIIMTGAWSLRKGCDTLVEAWRRLPGTRLLHVGPVVDVPLPDDPYFEHVDAVPQHELAQFYARAQVLALASREEGLALVQVQALASGLPVVCTDRTGGADLRAWTVGANAVLVVRPDDEAGLADALRTALDSGPAPQSVRDLLGIHREQLSWAAYAKRYEQRLLEELTRPQENGIIQ